MAQHAEGISNLDGLLDHLAAASEDREQVSIDAVHKAVGRRAFGPVLMIPGLLAMSPLSGMPGAPTAVGIMVLLIGGQLLIGRSEFWLPQFVLKRSVKRARFEKAIRFMRPIARFVDHLLKPRLTWLAEGAAAYVIAGGCVLLALAAPLMEVVPFAITGVGAAVTAFALALIADDGVLAIIAFAVCLVTVGLFAYAFL